MADEAEKKSRKAPSGLVEDALAEVHGYQSIARQISNYMFVAALAAAIIYKIVSLLH